MKKILGLDLGTNSIGWALTDLDFGKKEGKIEGLGSRILPMSQAILSDFGSGQSVSQTADRTKYRSTRRRHQRFLLRRERLHRVLNILEFLPKHYSDAIDFKEHFGQFREGVEVKINYYRDKKGKYRFLFLDAFNEMAKEFKSAGHMDNLPFDWTLYYLRKKGLSKTLTKEELAWVLLNFNQKRGYYQLREEEIEEDSSKDEKYYELKVIDVKEAEDQKKNGPKWYDIILENGFIYKRKSKNSLFEWIGKTKEFIVTTSLDKNGSEKLDKEGNLKRSLRMVNSTEDWIAIKKKTEKDLVNSRLKVGEFIYQHLLENPNQKIKGGLVKTIDRKYYKQELRTILETQMKFHPELQEDSLLLKGCFEELYPKNESHRQHISNKGFVHLFVEDIIFYQRPLRSKKSTIANCPYESRNFIKDGEKKIKPLKVSAKSNPLYQEFRIWQFIRNLRIVERNRKGKIDVPVTDLFLRTDTDFEELFTFLNSRKEVTQKQLLKHLNISDKTHRWNFVEDRVYPCNETKAAFLSRLEKMDGLDAQTFLTPENEQQLWHIVYSVKDKEEFQKALGSFASRKELDVISFKEAFGKVPPFDSEYGAYSQKVIKKLLPLMRQGKFWKEQDISSEVKERIQNILERLKDIDFDFEKIENIVDDDIPGRLLKSFIDKSDHPFSGLNTYQACYAVYNRHSEVGDITKWRCPTDIEKFLKEFRQHSLRNPIVEQVVTETLRVVKDIWQHYGKGEEKFFDEIHLELGRDMKNSKKKRESISRRNTENENTNERIKALLEELQEDPFLKGTVRTFSPSQQEILKIYEEGVYENSPETYRSIKLEEIEKIRKSNRISRNDIQKYKLWLEQGYVSPYTGKIISLTRLFSTDYQIEHIVPQSRYFNNSLNNKIICESEVNELKDNRTAFSFIQEERGRLVTLSGNRSVKLLSIEEYQQHCMHYFRKNRNKLKMLLSEHVPENFIERQLNDTRYISKFIKNLLSNIVREENEDAATSKNLLSVPGAITNILKQDWGLNDKWNELMVPRFQRLNQITGSKDFGYWDKNINAFRIQVPRELERGFSKKRIDHRHHALDALVLSCVTRDHITYLNSLNSQRNNHKLVSKLRERKTVSSIDRVSGKPRERNVAGTYHKPWSAFPMNAQVSLKECIVSIKQNTRVITKSNNKTWQWVNTDGNLKKELVPQTKGDNRAIRKPMHGETVYGRVKIKRVKGTISLAKAIECWELIVDKKIRVVVGEKKKFYKDNIKLLKKYFKENPIIIDGKKVEKVQVNKFVEGTAARIPLTEKFTRKQLDSVTDSGIRKILNKHLKNYIDEAGKEDFPLAFGPEGLDSLNENIRVLNNGKPHKAIYKVRVYEVGKKFPVGFSGNKKDKYVEATKGTNLYFAIYWNEAKQKRTYDTLPLNLVIERKKQGLSVAPEIDAEGNKLLFYLSPNDLVYVPSPEEQADPELVNLVNLSKEQMERIYRMEKTSGKECYFLPHRISKLIKSYDAKTGIGEFGSQNKLQKDIEDQKIADICLKLKIDRLGNHVKGFKLKYSKGDTESIIE